LRAIIFAPIWPFRNGGVGVEKKEKKEALNHQSSKGGKPLVPPAAALGLAGCRVKL
jgi:hypothetical protein